jgi:hypothetical protein
VASSRIPNPLERRHLLERELDAAQALRIAEAYLEEGRCPEAVAFLAKAGEGDRLRALQVEAEAEGDAFLVKMICAALEEEPSAESWRRVAEAAEASGKLRYASTARRQLERGED